MAAPFNEVHSTKKQRLLTRRRDSAGNEYVYLKGVGSTVAGSVVTYDEAGTSTLAVANAIGPVGIAQAAVDATTKFGWYMIYGTCNAACDASISDNAKVYIDGTAGRVDDTVVSGDQIMGAVFRGTDTSNLVAIEVRYPFASDSLG
jgi:hypothetical protein